MICGPLVIELLRKLARCIAYSAGHAAGVHRAAERSSDRDLKQRAFLWEHAEFMDWLVFNHRIDPDGSHAYFLIHGGWNT